MHDWVKDFVTCRTFQVEVGMKRSTDTIRKTVAYASRINYFSPFFLLAIIDIPKGVDGAKMSIFAYDSAILITM